MEVERETAHDMDRPPKQKTALGLVVPWAGGPDITCAYKYANMQTPWNAKQEFVKGCLTRGVKEWSVCITAGRNH
jgi:hypothetical protein